MDIIPTESRKLRACLLCSLIKTPQQFRSDGCDNCEPILRLKGSFDRVLECTTPIYSGTIALMSPTDSWVAKWQRIEKNCKGLYAIQVSGRLPDDVIDMLEDKGIVYFPRDQSR